MLRTILISLGVIFAIGLVLFIIAAIWAYRQDITEYKKYDWGKITIIPGQEVIFHESGAPEYLFYVNIFSSEEIKLCPPKEISNDEYEKVTNTHPYTVTDQDGKIRINLEPVITGGNCKRVLDLLAGQGGGNDPRSAFIDLPSPETRIVIAQGSALAEIKITRDKTFIDLEKISDPTNFVATPFKTVLVINRMIKVDYDQKIVKQKANPLHSIEYYKEFLFGFQFVDYTEDNTAVFEEVDEYAENRLNDIQKFSFHSGDSPKDNSSFSIFLTDDPIEGLVSTIKEHTDPEYLPAFTISEYNTEGKVGTWKGPEFKNQ